MPIESKNLTDRVNRIFGNSDDLDNSSIIGPSQKSSKDIFSPEDANYLQTTCKSIVASGQISQLRVSETLCRDTRGQELLAQFSIEQLISRLKYEEKKNWLKSQKVQDILAVVWGVKCRVSFQLCKHSKTRSVSQGL